MARNVRISRKKFTLTRWLPHAIGGAGRSSQLRSTGFIDRHSVGNLRNRIRHRVPRAVPATDSRSRVLKKKRGAFRVTLCFSYAESPIRSLTKLRVGIQPIRRASVSSSWTSRPDNPRVRFWPSIDREVLGLARGGCIARCGDAKSVRCSGVFFRETPL